MRIATIVLSLFLALQVAVMATSIGSKDGYLYNEKGEPAVTDYIGLWAAGRLAWEGRPAATYDWQEHDREREIGIGRSLPTLSPIAYPPTFLLIVAPFASLPYLPSMLLWTFLTLAAYVVVNARIIGRPEGAIWMAATPATLICFWLGQNGMVSAALLGAGLLALPKRPLLGGALLGLLSYKPHMGLLIPFALLAAGMWRPLAAAGVSAAVFALVSLVAFGSGTWVASVDSLQRLGQFMLYDFPTPERLQTLFGALRTMGIPIPVALTLQTALSLASIPLVVVGWRSNAPYRLKAALLAACLVVPTPYLFVYDMTLLTIAQAFLIAHILPGELERPDFYAIALANLAVAFAVGVAFPTAAFAAPLLIGAILVRMWPALVRQTSGPGAAVAA